MFLALYDLGNVGLGVFGMRLYVVPVRSCFDLTNANVLLGKSVHPGDTNLLLNPMMSKLNHALFLSI